MNWFWTSQSDVANNDEAPIEDEPTRTWMAIVRHGHRSPCQLLFRCLPVQQCLSRLSWWLNGCFERAPIFSMASVRDVRDLPLTDTMVNQNLELLKSVVFQRKRDQVLRKSVHGSESQVTLRCNPENGRLFLDGFSQKTLVTGVEFPRTLDLYQDRYTATVTVEYYRSNQAHSYSERGILMTHTRPETYSLYTCNLQTPALTVLVLTEYRMNGYDSGRIAWHSFVEGKLIELKKRYDSVSEALHWNAVYREIIGRRFGMHTVQVIQI